MALSELQILFRRCLHRRISANDFRDILKQYSLRQKVKSRDVVSTYINCCLHFCVQGDPLLPGYLQEILLSRYASLVDLITALLLQWKNARNSSEQEITQRIISTQSRILTELNIMLATNPNMRLDQLRQCIVLSARWLTAMAGWALSDRFKENINAHQLTEVLGVLLVSLLNLNTTVHGPDLYKAVQQALDQCMGAFPAVSMQLMNKLSTLPKPTQGESSDSVEPHMMEMAAIQFEEGIIHSTIIATRSATVALIQHLLSTGSTIDDSVVYSFLNTRHTGNHPIMFNDLIFASIDAMIKPAQNEMYQDQCLLFIFNKLPSILSIISTSSFGSCSSEQCLIDAWNYINAANADLAHVGRKLLQICAYLGLIPSETVNGLVGDDTTLKGLYAKEDLIAQVTANHSRGPRLVDEMLKNDGNAGSISQAIYEIMNNYCHMRETQHLKDMANAIVRKPAAINAIGMFIKPIMFLSSFCTLLDEWKWDEIHGESQPVYDEFGSVLLLILAFKQRLRLDDSAIGAQQKGFVARYLSSNNNEELELSESTQKHLGDWIKAMFIDEALSDDLTTSCSAQDFYMLLPTLLRQNVSAQSRGKLSHDTLKAGLEYLLEPFLLPSLPAAFGWIEHIADTEPETAQLVLRILINPPGGEARETHQTILAMGADRLHIDILPKAQFGLDPPQGDLTQIANETYTPLAGLSRTHGQLQVVQTLVSMLLQGDFPTMLDFVATLLVVCDFRHVVQVIRGKLGQYLKKGDNLFAEAVVHLSRRVELYANTLTTQDLAMEPFVPMNVANVNLDAVPETFQPPEQNEDIDQVLNEAAAMGMDQLDSTNLDDMYGLQANDFGLSSLDDLDLDMF